MVSDDPLRKLRILVDESGTLYKYANVDWLDGGQGLLIYDYYSGEKLSRHPNQTYQRVGGAGAHTAPTTELPFSDIEHQVVREARIPSDATQHLPKYHGTASTDAFVFSSTVMQSNGTFAAELVADGRIQETLAAWRRHPDYLSAQTCRSNQQGHSVILTVLNSRFT